MRAALGPYERFRIVHGSHGTSESDGLNGAFRLPGPEGMTLLVLASDGTDWASCGLPGDAWEHVSISLPRRTPTWAEMEFVRGIFFKDEETVLQFSVPRVEHISYHDFCLHMWRPIGWAIRLPPVATVAPTRRAHLDRR